MCAPSRNRRPQLNPLRTSATYHQLIDQQAQLVLVRGVVLGMVKPEAQLDALPNKCLQRLGELQPFARGRAGIEIDRLGPQAGLQDLAVSRQHIQTGQVNGCTR
jgi:hypothetical protein